MNDIISNAVSNVADNATKSASAKEFVKLYSQKSPETITWKQLCEDVRTYKAHSVGLSVLCELLKSGKYQGEYKEKLTNNLSMYEKMFSQRIYILDKIFCGDKIKNQIVYQAFDSSRKYWFDTTYVEGNNQFLLTMLSEYLASSPLNARYNDDNAVMEFEHSFTDYAATISKLSDFTSKTFFTQVEYYKNHFKDDEENRALGLRFVCHFYRWLVNKHPENKFFENSFEMTEHLLFNNRLPELLERGFYFTTLNPTNIPHGKDKVCFILRGFHNDSTRITEEDYVTLDLSRLQSVFYRDLLLDFLSTSVTGAAVKWVGPAVYICEAMQALYECKQARIYPNKKENYLTNQEAVFIRKFFDAQDIGIRTKNNKIGAVRRYLNYCVGCKKIEVDDLFFDYLIQYEEPNKNTAKTVPDKALVAINKYLSDKSKESLFYKEMYVIFHLAIQTEFRINQICHLQIDCIKPTVKPNQFKIQTNSKTSHGRKDSYVISPMTYHLLMDIIEETETAREECCVDSMKNYIFLYQKHRMDAYSLFDDSVFTRHLTAICSELGLERYTASNLRDTHMTKSLEHIIRNGKSDMEMSVLSKHKHLDTTKNHYIEMELEKMLESTYGITIGTELIETDSKIVDAIPEEFAGEENDVENGCGKCTAETCVMTNALPCMACKHFITTEKHEIFFKKAIENINRLIDNTKNRHDKEDLVTIKELYVLYLKAIIKHKEGIKHDD